MWREIGVYVGVSAPAIDGPVSGSVELTGRNSFEISGRVSAGTGKIYLLRKVVYLDAGRKFQFRPFWEDRPADSADFVDGWFSIRTRILQDDPTEEIVLWDPGGAFIFDPAAKLLVRECNY